MPLAWESFQSGTEVWQLNLLTRRFRDSIFLLGKILAGALVADPAYLLLTKARSKVDTMQKWSKPCSRSLECDNSFVVCDETWSVIFRVILDFSLGSTEWYWTEWALYTYYEWNKTVIIYHNQSIHRTVPSTVSVSPLLMLCRSFWWICSARSPRNRFLHPQQIWIRVSIFM